MEQTGAYSVSTENRPREVTGRIEGAGKTDGPQTGVRGHFDLFAGNVKPDFRGAFGDSRRQGEEGLVRLGRETEF